MATDGDRRVANRIVLVLGDPDRDESRTLWMWLKHLVGDAGELVVRPDMMGQWNDFPAAQIPDLVVVFQSWSDEFSPHDIRQLFALAPLARVVVCYGAWCESDGRNRQLWPLSVRVPIWNAAQRIEREWKIIQCHGELAPLPWSASREEIFAADHPADQRGQLANRRVLIDSPDPALRTYLTERLLDQGGIRVATDPEVIVFDVDPWGACRQEGLAQLRRQYPETDVIAVANLIQPDLVASLQAHHVSHVLSKFTFL